MFKTTVKLALGAALLTSVAVHAHYSPDCELRLRQAKIYEALVDEAADFELELLALESVCRGGRCRRDAQNLRAEFGAYIETLLDERHPASEMLATFAKLVTSAQHLHAQALRPKSSPAAAVTGAVPKILEFESRPEALRGDAEIETGNAESYIRTVTFASTVLPEFWDLNSQQQRKFLRAIYLGIVGPVGESGVKQLTFIAKHLVEVKAYGGTRLFGCLETGRLRVLRVDHETSHDRLWLMKYRSLCD